jgi:hypothetical protein
MTLSSIFYVHFTYRYRDVKGIGAIFWLHCSVLGIEASEPFFSGWC